jgi:hypothetical protein
LESSFELTGETVVVALAAAAAAVVVVVAAAVGGWESLSVDEDWREHERDSNLLSSVGLERAFGYESLLLRPR